MENPEHVLMELNSLEKEPQDCLPDVSIWRQETELDVRIFHLGDVQCMLVPQVLEKYLVFVAKTGNTVGQKV